MTATPHANRNAPSRPAARLAGDAYRLDRLRLRHLRLLELIAERGSLGNAARGLGVSQPACTLMLRELEEVFGARLVERGTRGGRLTPAGTLALERLTIALSSVARAAEAARTPELAPLLHVGCIQVAGTAVVPAVLARLERDGAGLRVALREGRAVDLMASLCAGELDCVIGWMDATILDALPVAQLSVSPLSPGRMQVVAARGHPLARRRLASVEPLLGWPWIVPPAESRTHAAFRRLFLQHGVAPPAVTVECAALHTTLHVVAATRYLAVAPDAAVAAYARRGMVVALKGPALEVGQDRMSIAIRRDSEPLPAIRAFRDAARSLAR